MWPKPSSGTPSAEWVPRGANGFYLLHTDFANLAAAVALPGSTSGIMAPYQERPQIHPLELILHVDPVKDRQRMFPLLMAIGSTKETAANAALEAKLSELNEQLPALYTAHAARCMQQERELTSILTPDRDPTRHCYGRSPLSDNCKRASRQHRISRRVKWAWLRDTMRRATSCSWSRLVLWPRYALYGLRARQLWRLQTRAYGA